MITEKDVEFARNQALNLNLAGKELLFDNSTEKILSICNGIGPEWFPEILRNALDKLHPSLKTVGIIHDLQYYYGKGSKKDFLQANQDFVNNGLKTAASTYYWFDPRRYIARHKAREFGALLNTFGRVAYDSAIKDRKKEGKAK